MKHNSKKNVENRIPIENLFKEDYKVSEGNNRHEDLLRIMESHIARNKEVLTEGIKKRKPMFGIKNIVNLH